MRQTWTYCSGAPAPELRSVAEVFELQRQFVVAFLQQRHRHLQVVALLAGDAQLVAVDLRFDLQLGVLDGGHDLLGQLLLDALLIISIA